MPRRPASFGGRAFAAADPIWDDVLYGVAKVRRCEVRPGEAVITIVIDEPRRAQLHADLDLFRATMRAVQAGTPVDIPAYLAARARLRKANLLVRDLAGTFEGEALRRAPERFLAFRVCTEVVERQARRRKK